LNNIFYNHTRAIKDVSKFGIYFPLKSTSG